MLNYTISETDMNGLIYSVDMVRYSLKFKYDTVIEHRDGTLERVTGREDFVKFMGHLADYSDLQVRYYPSFKEFGGYRHLWVISCNDWDSTVSIGLEPSTKTDDRYKGFIEYNPNKVYGADFDRLFNYVCMDCERVTLKRYDMAIDFPCIRSLCRLDMNGLISYELHYEHGTYTEYTGERNKPGRTKLYDKRAESKLDYDLCRLEYTCDKDTDFSKLCKVLVSSAQLGLNPDKYELRDVTQVAVSLLIEQDAPLRNKYLKDLLKKTRTKIEQYLDETVLSLDLVCCKNLLKSISQVEF